MDPATILSLVVSGISDLKLLMPEIQKLTRSGLITVEQQQQVLNGFNSLNQDAQKHFSGPEWEVSSTEN